MGLCLIELEDADEALALIDEVLSIRLRVFGDQASGYSSGI